MRTKRITSIVFLLVGAVVIIISLIAKHKIGAAQGKVSRVTGWGGDNAVTSTIGGALQDKIGSYNEPVFWFFIAGLALVVIGGWSFFCCCCKKHTKKRRR